jgi:hypothetical protein
MKPFKWMLIAALLLNGLAVKAQLLVDSVKFFTDDKLIEMTLTTDIKKLQTEKNIDVYQDASINMRFPDSSFAEETIKVCARGHFRRTYCNIPPLMVNFKSPGASKLSKLGKLKLVIGCGTANDDEQLILKEYLCYKMYNLLDEKSFRVRLVRVNYRDTRGKMKPFTQYAFFIEDDAELARRNNCVKKDKAQVLTESTNRDQMTMVAVFEYLISNGDWSVPNNHNIKLIWDKQNPNNLPFAVPYDFDHSGMVNAGYAAPNELLGTESVTERVYRGFPRAMDELESTFDVYRKQKDNIINLVNNFTLLSTRNRKDLVSYIGEFYKTINDSRQVQTVFIDNARKN